MFGQKRFLQLPPGLVNGEPTPPRRVPGIVISEPETQPVTLPRTGKVIQSQFAWIISQRENLQGETYLVQTFENLRFAPLRFNEVKGLDVSETGGTMGLEVLMDRLSNSIMARQEAQGPTVAPVLSLDESE